jgi:hypothetical protein
MEVVQRGWDHVPPGVGPWLDRAFAGDWPPLPRGAFDELESDRFPRTAASDWPGLLHRGVHLEPGLVADPRRERLFGSAPEVERSRRAVLALTARAFQLQARGDDESGLELLSDALALTRRLRHPAPLSTLFAAQRLEGVVAHGLAHWAAGVRRLDLLRRALEEADRHEKQLPPTRDALLAERILAPARYREFLEDLAGITSHTSGHTDRMVGQLLVIGQKLPWEAERV